MKKLILAAALVVAGFAVEAKASVVNDLTVNVGEPKWEKSAAGTWMGAEKTWYKLNPKDASIWWSKDGKKWEAVKDGMWQDKEGKWLKIVDKDLKWSADGGKTWSQVPDWTWEGHDGVWNKFDKDWSLWTAKK
ncbi:MAG: hypothetical protein K0S33_2792 [Bacteroidetes bacterium]|jgi:hypothetical protein|nr:hypothetical protein [Bacteroidota bacterium]